MNDDSRRELAWSTIAGASYGAVAVAFVLVVDLANPTFAPALDFVLSAAAGTALAGALCWWRGAERPGVRTRRRSALVGAVVGFVAPTLAFALNSSVYGSTPNVLLDLLGGVVAASILGVRGHVGTYGLPIALGALAGWSLAGWFAALRD